MEADWSPCSVCSTITRMGCGACEAVHYCSSQCRDQAWPLHKLECVGDRQEDLNTDWFNREYADFTFKPSKQCWFGGERMYPNNAAASGYSQVVMCAYDMKDLDSTIRELVVAAVWDQAYASKGCTGLTSEYFYDKLNAPNLRFVFLFQVSLNGLIYDDHQVPVATALFTETRPNAMELEILCSYSFPDTAKQDRMRDAVAQKYGLWYAAEGFSKIKDPKQRQAFEEEYFKTSEVTLRTGFGVIMMCLSMRFLKERGITSVSLEAAHGGLIGYYARFGFELSETKQTNRGRRVADVVAFDQLMATGGEKALRRYLDRNMKRFKSKSGSWKMLLRDMDAGIVRACAWAQRYLEVGLPQTFWTEEYNTRILKTLRATEK